MTSIELVDDQHNLEGSSELRAGFSTSETDDPAYTCENIVSRFRDRKRGANVVLCGNNCYVDAQARANIKSPFDGDVVCGFDIMVCVNVFESSAILMAGIHA